MPIMFEANTSDAEKLLIEDSYTKLCAVPFPVEAARAPVVMHYDAALTQPTLIFMCNAFIHMRRVTPPASLRINGVATKKYAIVPCSDYPEDEVTDAVAQFNELGYYAYTSVVNGNVKLYISWDEQCLSAATAEAEGAGEVDGSSYF